MRSGVYGSGLNDWNTFTLDYEVDVLGLYDGATTVLNRAHGRTDALNLTNIWDNVTPAQSQSFWYNPSNQLQNADGPWGAKIFYHDLVGNRSTEITTPPGGSATTDTTGYPSNTNRLVTVTRGVQTVRAFT